MEQNTIHTAIENLQNILGINVLWKPAGQLDGKLTFHINQEEIILNVEIKKEIRAHQIEQLRFLKEKYIDLIVVAEKIFPKVKEQLREENIAYLEENGNFYLKRKVLWFWIDNNKTIENAKDKGNRAFTKTGLKVLFQFLLDKELINKTQREIAERTGVGLGNIPQIIQGLKETGYLLALNKQEYVWENRKALLDRWITEYETTLKPSLLKGKYKMRKRWNQLELNKEVTVWGGEPAGDLLTNHLRPEIFTLYTKEETINLMKNYQLMPDKNGELEVYEMFWQNNQQINQAPPLLIYTDLILSNNKRCRETAELIYNEHIQANL